MHCSNSTIVRVVTVGRQRQFQLKNKYSASCKFALFLHVLLKFHHGQGDAGKGTEAVPAEIDQFIKANLHTFFSHSVRIPQWTW